MAALFNKKSAAKPAATKKATEDKEPKVVEATVVDTKVKKVGGLEQNMVLIRPHITEKATDLSEQNIYAFEIARGANKAMVRQAVEKFYKVKPTKVAVIMGMAKYAKNPRTGRLQPKKTAIKKALVYLKKGDKIEFV